MPVLVPFSVAPEFVCKVAVKPCGLHAGTEEGCGPGLKVCEAPSRIGCWSAPEAGELESAIAPASGPAPASKP